MNRPADRSNPHRPALNWRVLGLLNLYRVLVPLVLIGLYSLGGGRGIAVDSTRLFFGASVAYLCVGLIGIALVRRRRPTADLQTAMQATADVVVLMLLLHATGGVTGSLGLLLLVPVGSLAFILPPRSALFLAAVAVLAVLGHTIALELDGRADIAALGAAGLLGSVLLTLAATASMVAGRMRESEALVRQKDVDLANLAELSQYIVHHLRESLLVVDESDRIRLINPSAAEILGDRQAVPGALVGEASPRLLYSLTAWRRHERGDGSPATFVAADGGRVIQPHFAPLGGAAPGPMLIFLEDTSLMAERVQQSKLASLGRLSASIAHEIRNPVGAMSHAAQLLAESAAIGAPERRLTDIIRANAERVSGIIDNVLQLSRREGTKPTRLAIGEWLDEFIEEFSVTMQVPETDMDLGGALADAGLADGAPDIEVRFDPGHLRQVLWNLCENALKYGAGSGGPRLEIRAGRLNPSHRPFLEVADRGPGIERAAVDRIFEPFFTGPRGGTGLGLFIARELCQLNRAVLLYEPRPDGGSVFRIVFSDPRRWAD